MAAGLRPRLSGAGARALTLKIRRYGVDRNVPLSLSHLHVFVPVRQYCFFACTPRSPTGHILCCPLSPGPRKASLMGQSSMAKSHGFQVDFPFSVIGVKYRVLFLE